MFVRQLRHGLLSDADRKCGLWSGLRIIVTALRVVVSHFFSLCIGLKYATQFNTREPRAWVREHQYDNCQRHNKYFIYKNRILTFESVPVLNHPSDDFVDFHPLVLDIENILTDAIATCIVCVNLSCGVFGVTPRERWWA